MKNKTMKKKLGRPAIYTPEEARLRKNARAKKRYANLPPEQKLWEEFSSCMSTNLNKHFATPEEREALAKKNRESSKKWRNTNEGKEWQKNHDHPLTPKEWSRWAYNHYKTSHNKLKKNGRIASDSEYDLTPKLIFNSLKKQNFQCAETGIKFTFGTPNCPNKPSYDRINNDDGYRNKNLRLVTAQTNVSRNDLSVENHRLRQVLTVERMKRNNPEEYKRLLSEVESKYEYALI